MAGKRQQPQDREPTALDLLDPSPAADEDDLPDQLPAAVPREPGEIEQSVIDKLRELPGSYGKHPIAAGARRLARELDSNLVIGRDAAGHVREMRQCMATLHEMAPGERKGDQTDDLRARRETRMLAAGD